MTLNKYIIIKPIFILYIFNDYLNLTSITSNNIGSILLSTIIVTTIIIINLLHGLNKSIVLISKKIKFIVNKSLLFKKRFN